MQYDHNRATDIQDFFSKDYQIDTHKILNRSDYIIPSDLVAAIESDGITSEQIEAWKAPVFKYNTQITVHGIFNTSSNGYIGRYKNLIVNKNESVGIKYNAVDKEKKERIYSALRLYGFHTCNDSTSWYAYKLSPAIPDKEALNAALVEYRALVNLIPETSFVGKTSVFAFKHQWFGTVHVMAQITINAVKDCEMWNVIESLTGNTKDQILEREQADKIEREKKEAQDHEYWKQKDSERAAMVKQAENHLTDNGYIKKQVTTDGRYFNVAYDGEIESFIVYTVKGKKFPRYQINKVKTVAESVELKQDSYMNDRNIFKGRKLWTKD